MFGENPVAINKLFKDCMKKTPKFKEKYAFMTLQWLKTYAFEVDLAGRYKCCERTVEKKVKEYTQLFQSFIKSKVKLSGFDKRIYQFVVDGQNYNTYEFRMKPSSKWYNHKSHSAGVKYLYACHLYESRLVYMEGPLPCGINDISMYKGEDKDGSKKNTDALYYKVKEMNETRRIKGFADSGFVGVPKQLTTTRNAHSKEMKELIARAKARQESFNSRMSRFGVLRSRFRHGKGTEKRLALHKSCTEAVCVIVHYGMENGSPLFDV